MISPSKLRRSCLGLVLLAAGCTASHVAWRRLDQPTPLKPDEIVWIWGGGVVNKWDAVVITQDSVSGVPYELPLPCDSCRRSLPRTQVDSMAVAYNAKHLDSKEGLDVAGAVGLVILLEIVVCTAIGATHC